MSEEAAFVAADDVWDGNYIRLDAQDPWVRVVDSEETDQVLTYIGSNGERVSIEWRDNQIAVKTEVVPAETIRPDDDIQHPEVGDWVKLRKIDDGIIGTRSGDGERKSRQITFYFEADETGRHLAEFDSYVAIPGEKPVKGTPKNSDIRRRVRD